MVNDKTLIAYETKQGVTRETAGVIAEELRSEFGLEVDLVDLNEEPTPDLMQYHNIIVGAGVRMGKVYNKATKFLENDFSGKQVAFFASSAWGGTPGEYYESAMKRFVGKTLSKYPKISVVSKEAFGGRIRYFKKTMVDNVDLTKVKASYSNDKLYSAS